MSRLKKTYHSGFTLLEVVVAVAIFALISSITFPALIQFLDARERIEERNQQILEMQKVFLFLQKDLRYTLGRKLKDEYGDPADHAFDAGGTGQYLMKITTLYPDINISNLSLPRMVVWKVEHDSLVRMQWPVLEPYIETQPYKQVMLQNVQNIELRFAKVENKQLKWSTTWSEEDDIPRALEIILIASNEVEYRRLFEMSGYSQDNSLIESN